MSASKVSWAAKSLRFVPPPSEATARWAHRFGLAAAL
jgi:hypothetical protein